MSQLKAGKIQSGISVTSANNMVLDASGDDGTFTFKREDGSTLFTIDATGLMDVDGSGKLYGRDNILGTVSESGGVPTGAIMEAGSNANGRYIKYTDGTLICEGEITSSATAQTTITYPAPFYGSTQRMVGSVYASGITDGYSVHFLGRASSAIFMNAVSSSGRVAILVAWIAIGRWY